jgi:hypothetical protein
VASGPSGTTPKYLSALFHAGTAAGLRDRELLERFGARRGTKDEAAEIAFAALVERYGPMVLATCRAVLGDPHQAEDAFPGTGEPVAGGQARRFRRSMAPRRGAARGRLCALARGQTAASRAEIRGNDDANQAERRGRRCAIVR